MTTETETAFHELLAEVQATHARMVEQLADDEATLLEAHRWVLSILQVAAEVNIWADPSRPRFVEIVGPYEKWGGDNADAFYQYAPIDPNRTYRVRGRKGDAAIFPSLTVIGGPNDGRYWRGSSARSTIGSWSAGEDGTVEFVSSASRGARGHPVGEAEAGTRCCAPITRDDLEEPTTGRRMHWDIECLDPPTPTAGASPTPTWLVAFAATTTWFEEQVAMAPVNLADPQHHRRARPCAHRDVRVGRRRRRLRHGQLRPGRRRGAGHPGPVAGVRVPGTAACGTELLHTFNYDYSALSGPVTLNGSHIFYDDDGSWTIVLAASDPLPRANPTALDPGPSPRPHLVPMVPARRDAGAAPGGGPPGGHRMRRPAPLRIDDLATPRFSNEARAILDLMEEAGSQLTLDPGELMATARAETGLDGFGPEDFVERLAALCQAMRDQGGFNGAGIMQQHVLLVGLLKNRLLHPGPRAAAPRDHRGADHGPDHHLRVAATAPPHNLMSADPTLRSLPYWESLEPVLDEREQPVPGAPDPRLERTAVALSFLNTALPYFNRMHEMTVEHAHEEIQLLAIDFSTMLFETTAPMPAWRDAYLSRDQRPTYAYLLKVLKVLQWLRGGMRCRVLKTPQHLEQFPALVDTFPDATFVVTHRDPVSVTASMLTMIAYTARLTRDQVDLEAIGNYWSDRLERMLRRCAGRARNSSCQPTGRLTCGSTSSWRTTSPWWPAFTTWPASRSRNAPARRWRRSWRRTHEVVTGASRTMWPNSASTAPSDGGRCPSTPIASGSRPRPDGSGCGSYSKRADGDGHGFASRRAAIRQPWRPMAWRSPGGTG